MPTRYVTMTISISRDVDEYRLDFKTSIGHNIEGLSIPFSPRDVVVMTRYLQRIRTGNGSRHWYVKKCMQDIGSLLFQRVIGEISLIQQAFNDCIEAISTARRKKEYRHRYLRIEIEIAQDAELFAFPWELLCRVRAAEGAVDYLLHEDHSITRRVGTNDRFDRASLLPTTTPLINALVAFACPIWAVLPEEDKYNPGSYRIDSRTEKALRSRVQIESINFLPFFRILEKIQSFVGPEVFCYTLLENATYTSVENALSSGRYNVFYYIGHSYYDYERKTTYLLLEDQSPARDVAPLQADMLRQLLGNHGIRLVILSACNSARYDTKMFLSGAVQAVADLSSITAVVGMQLDVPIYTAEAFDMAFFTELASLAPLDHAVSRGRQAMVRSLQVAGENAFDVADWAIPVLLARSDRLYEDMVTIPYETYQVGLSTDDLEAIKQMFIPGSYEETVLNRFDRRYCTINTSFEISCCPVTNYQYKQFLDVTRYDQLPDGWTSHSDGVCFPDGKAMHPVVNVSLRDAQAYCQWRGMTLPSADQWEIAARGLSYKLFPWGNTFEGERCNLDKRDIGTTSVYKYPAGRSDYGVWDMIGNVCEWTSTATRGEHVILGGFWCMRPVQALPSLRPVIDPRGRYPFVGFRCMRSMN